MAKVSENQYKKPAEYLSMAIFAVVALQVFAVIFIVYLQFAHGTKETAWPILLVATALAGGAIPMAQAVKDVLPALIRSRLGLPVGSGAPQP